MTSPIATVIAASDFSLAAQRAAMRAGLLAKAHGGSLQLMHVLEGTGINALRRTSPGSDLEERVRIEAMCALDSLADDVIRSGGVVADRLLREGRIIDEILAASAQAELLVLGPRGVNPIRDFVIGSTAERLARRVVCPMLVAKQDPQIHYEHVFVPVDFSEFSAPAVRFAADLAPAAVLHIFHALDCSLDGTLRSAGASAEAVMSYHEQLAQEANTTMNRLTASVPDRNIAGVVEPGDARALINRRAAELRCTLIVMGKQGRSWLAEHILGSVTRLVLEHAVCDVVVVPQHAEAS
ncbi:MAG TPA: universal stress protein [Steroidobacteraceae bacterium]|jgi:nucleotide-binding universal stress UspA family protein